jgi:hypothetical protein
VIGDTVGYRSAVPAGMLRSPQKGRLPAIVPIDDRKAGERLDRQTSELTMKGRGNEELGVKTPKLGASSRYRNQDPNPVGKRRGRES